MNIKKITALITGGASGLGEACVRRLVEQGAKVVFIDLNETRGQALAQELGNSVRFVKANVTNEEEIQLAIDTALQTYGGLHVAINCAGIGSATKTLGKEGVHSLEIFQKVIQVNLIGTFNVIRLIKYSQTER